MSSGDWSADITYGSQILGDLTSASPVRPGESHTPNQEVPGAPRRRARQKAKIEIEDPDENERPSSDPGDQPEHRLDHLA